MGKGGGSSHTPTEAPDSLKSRQQLSIIDMLCEGPIEGPVGGLRGVYLNKTPVQGDDGTNNFSGVQLQWVAGTQTQEHLSGFPSSENEISVGSEVKYSTPIVRTITDVDIDRIRVTVGVQALYEVNDKGDTNGSRVQLLVQVGSGSVWRTVETVDFSGKTRSQYLRSVIIDNLPPRPFNIRVARTIEDSTSSRLENRTLWSSYTEIIDTKLTYPNTAAVGLLFDSEQFNGVPSRQYLIDGMIIRIPDNYDPVNRTYSGVWSGNFKFGWTNNPAWIYYDMAMNERYGMGKRLGPFGADKFMLYTIGQYCDQFVPDGFGGTEPRMTCNAYITDARAAYELLNDLGSIFRSIPVWNGLQMTAIMDRPADPVWRYSNANVVDGKFSRSSSAQKARHTAAHVRYIDPFNGWETATEYVADDDMIARYGLNVLQVDAFGCTSRGQAHRAGKWLLETERLERMTITFEVGREGLKHLPGDIIEIADNDYAGARIGGRIVSISEDRQTVTLDRDVVINEGEQAFFGYIDADGTPQRVQVFSQPEPNVLVLGKAIAGMTDFGMWTLSTASLKPELFRALGISESDGVYTITAVQHEPQKEAVVDRGTVFEPDTNTLYSGAIPPVEHLQIEAVPDSDAYQIRMTWDTPRVISDLSFEVKLMRGDAVHKRETVRDTEFLCGNLPLGDYTVSIRGKSAVGQIGTETTAVFEIGPPALPDSLQITAVNFSVTIKPVVTKPTSLGTQYEFYKGMTEAEVLAQTNYLGRASVLNDVNCTPDTEYWYGVQAVNGVGRSALLVRRVRTQLKPEDILDLIGPEIPKLDWAKDLQNLVEENSSQVVLLSDRAALVVNKDGRISGITVTAGDEASAVDFLADFVAFTDPVSLERNLYWDNRRRTLVLKGEIQLLDGTSVSSKHDLGNGAGGIFRIKSATGIFPEDTDTVNALFVTAFGTSPAQDTVLTFYAVDGSGKVTAANSRMYNGTAWITPQLFIDGDLIALGTIRGDRLVAGSEIYAPVIKGGLVESGTIRSSGNPPTFELLPNGTLTARNANISGVINANAGTFNNVTIGESCTIKRLYADVIYGNIVSMSGSFNRYFDSKYNGDYKFCSIVGAPYTQTLLLLGDLIENMPATGTVRWIINGTVVLQYSKSQEIKTTNLVIRIPPLQYGVRYDLIYSVIKAPVYTSFNGLLGLFKESESIFID